MPASTFKHASQVDEPTFSASDLKAYLDLQAEEIIAWFNATHIGTDKSHMGDNPAAYVYHNVSQSIPNNTTTALAFNSERYDNDSMHDNATNNTKITINTAGKYSFSINIGWDTNATGLRSIGIRLNGTTYIAYTQEDASGLLQTIQTLTKTYNFSVGDYIEAIVSQTSGASISVFANYYSPSLSIVRVG